MNAQLVFGLVLLGSGGEAFALAGTGAPVVTAALVYFAVLLFTSPVVWALQLIDASGVERQADLIVRCVFLAPITFAVGASLLVIAI